MKPGHVALGTWSGGRFMHFGEPLDDERLAAVLLRMARATARALRLLSAAGPQA